MDLVLWTEIDSPSICTAFTVRRTILCPAALGRDAQNDNDQTTSGKGSQTSLRKVGSCTQHQAAKHSKMLMSLLFTSPVPELQTAKERARLPVHHTTGTVTSPQMLNIAA